ncbi:S9 family peptidase [Xanthocytophaga agilis]|uniref:S9 family peptidase n=1 Tax=Xanthocytophaga agilis TaxID=3048010 RepID=A0AAE3UD55_9BACT|nr:S9 family peptidase [Xanthocytophaga agilis]MDJ1500850.1 S9 family peptidase [Xanthocytophaga agilis]
MRKPLFLPLVLLILLLFATEKLLAQKAQLTIEDIFARPTFNPKGVQGVNWMKNGGFYTSLVQGEDGKATVVKYDVTTGTPVETLFQANVLGSQANSVDGYELSPNEDKLLIATERESIYRRSSKAVYYIYDLKTKQVTKLSSGGKQSNAAFSPDGSKVAFTRDNNLFIADLKAGTESAVTTDGKFNHIINGSTDWVYEEEFGFTQAFEWNADGTKVAYYTFNETEVPEYNMQVWGKLYPVDYRYKYPKAGEKNSVITISVFDLAKKSAAKIDIGTETDIYIPRINWTHNPNVLSVRRMNRLQNKLDILHADASTGKTTTILTETSNAYVDLEFTDHLTYLADGKHFIHASEQSGFKHLYLYDINGKLIRQITNGNWEVSNFLGLDEKKKLVYFTSTEVSPMERHLYSISLDGKTKKKLSVAKGTHRPNFSVDFSYYLDSFSDANTPASVGLYTAPTGKLVKMLETNEVLKSKLQQQDLTKKEFFQFTTPDNVTLNGWMMKPVSFDPNKKYPVFMFVYGGPGSQQVTDEWSLQSMWFQLLTQKGYIVACVDNRGTGARGTAFRQVTYANLGKYEVQDQIEGAKYLGKQSYVDAGRIGIHGWSYGGYMAALCMTVGADYFKMGISGAPVTTWRFYDSIYTERYLKRPQDNAAGYDDNSPVTHAGKLKGKFLLVHGTGDDNVHFQNSIALQQELINNGKQFETFVYPNQAHGVRGKSRIHLYNLMTNFILENL